MWPLISLDFGVAQGQLYSYAIFVALGLCHLFIGLDASSRNRQLDRAQTTSFFYILGFAAISGWGLSVLGSQLLDTGNLPFGSVAAMPGVVAAVLILFSGCRMFGISSLVYLELTAPMWCFAHAWGRIGCFMGGCCHGGPTESLFGVQFPENSLAFHRYGDLAVHPTQLYEFFLLLLIGVWLLYGVKFGRRLSVYLLTYGVGRFVIEFFRGDSRGELGFVDGLSPSQHFCILFVILGALIFYRNREEGNPLPNSSQDGAS